MRKSCMSYFQKYPMISFMFMLKILLNDGMISAALALWRTVPCSSVSPQDLRECMSCFSGMHEKYPLGRVLGTENLADKPTCRLILVLPP